VRTTESSESRRGFHHSAAQLRAPITKRWAMRVEVGSKVAGCLGVLDEFAPQGAVLGVFGELAGADLFGDLARVADHCGGEVGELQGDVEVGFHGGADAVHGRSVGGQAVEDLGDVLVQALDADPHDLFDEVFPGAGGHL
jgi:hypothetical protein